MRTIPASIASQLAEGKTRLSRCVKIVLRDGTELHFSDHDEDLEIDLGDGSYAATYTGDSGITSGDWRRSYAGGRAWSAVQSGDGLDL